MGIYINPGYDGFATVRADTYVDKTGLVAVVNRTLGTSRKLTCVSRARRFGKSFAAKMLCAYYDRTCDSAPLFDDLDVARDPSYRTHLNKYNVLNIDLTQMLYERRGAALVPYVEATLLQDLRREFPDVELGDSLTGALAAAVEASGALFVAVFDEWDAPVRETPDSASAYFEFLRSLFKSSVTTDRVFAGAYMTGILPIRKSKGQSAVSDFWEYSMLDPGPFAPYVGFLEDDVRALCEWKGLDFERMRSWYDGYEVGEVRSVYNPYAVMRAARFRKYKSYWRQTAAADMLLSYIDLDFEGLQDDVVRLMAGEELEVETSNFQNDVHLIESRDNALTLMVHLGYLTFEEECEGRGWARIPNYEIRTEFEKVLRRARHPELVRLVRASDELLEATLALDGEAVAAAVAKVHDSNYAPKALPDDCSARLASHARAQSSGGGGSRTGGTPTDDNRRMRRAGPPSVCGNHLAVPKLYNGEQALRHTVKMAYISATDRYARVEELPSGHGLADVVYLPRRRSPLPALVVELKWNREDGGAIAQIRDRDYAALPRDLVGEVLLVGITYDEKTKAHACTIEHDVLGA